MRHIPQQLPSFVVAVLVGLVFTLPLSAQTIVSAEYFWDDDPGHGKATVLTITPGAEADVVGSIPAPAQVGMHRLGLRYYGDQGWSPTIVTNVDVLEGTPNKVLCAEYFWDIDPGFGKGTPLLIAEGAELDIDQMIVADGTLAPGMHQLGMRYHGMRGWSPTVVNQVFLPSTYDVQTVRAEYFWNIDPGFGKGTPIDIEPGEELELADVGIPSFDVHGDATLFIRYQSSTGVWSPTVSYVVMVDAEGNYTLDATQETSMEGRNYQSATDAFSDFADRGVGNDIILTIPTADTEYAIDATDGDVLANLTVVAEGIENISTARSHKSITFTAAEGSGNSVSVTANEADLPDVVSLFAQTTWQNVSLTINGTPYDFSSVSERMAELCNGEETTIVALGSIGGDITAQWTAQPHAGTTLSGYSSAGTGDLPAMTLTNSGTRTDSLAYDVTLTSANGTQLYNYTYYIYVRTSLSGRTFSGISPAAGSSLDPGTVTLKWNGMDEVMGYRLRVVETAPLAEGSDTPESTETTYELDANVTRYAVTAKSGYSYEWQVTAIGMCDELESPAYTFTGRLLPDLAVASVTAPEGAEAGNAITVTATIVNQGEGSTTETSWTDRLYYTIGSEDFSTATLVKSVSHSGSLAAGGSYDLTFNVTVPDMESGIMRYFVVADGDNRVMETSTDNNRAMSSGIDLRPFYVNTDDLATLRQLHSQFGGASWNGTLWDTTSELIRPGNWSGVTFDTEGCVTAINLQGRGLSGTLSISQPLALTRLTSLNLSRNALTGDPAMLISTETTPQLTTLNLGYNLIDALSAPLPATITSLNLGNQHRTYSNSTLLNGMDALDKQTLDIGSDMHPTVPALYGYDHAKQDFSAHPALNVWTTDMKTRHGQLVWSPTYERYAYNANSWNQTAPQDADVILLAADGTTAAGSAQEARMHFLRGDVNLSGWVDVNDVQSTLVYMLGNQPTVFGHWAANTYTDEETEEVINIQDIVCTVNIVLDNENSAAARRRIKGTADTSGMAGPQACFHANGSSIWLSADTEVAAFYVELQGVSDTQVKLLLNRNQWTMQTRNTNGGVRLVVFSPTGDTLPMGDTQLLRMSGAGEPVSAECSSPNAEPIPTETLSGNANGIDDMPQGVLRTEGILYDLQGRRVGTSESLNNKKLNGIYIINGKKVKKGGRNER